MNKILLSDETNFFTEQLTNILIDRGFEVIHCAKDGFKVMENIELHSPQVVIMDVFMSGTDAIDVMNRCSASGTVAQKPIYIVYSVCEHSFLQQEVVRAGASYYFTKPYDFKVLSDRVIYFLNNCPAVDRGIDSFNINSTIEANVANVLLELGVPVNVKGYNYLRTAIVIVVNDQTKIRNITKGLYLMVGEACGGTAGSVERAMRSAIDAAWSRVDSETINKYFGYKVHHELRGSATNSEFIATVAEKIRMKIDSYTA